MSLELKKIPYSGWLEKYNRLMKDEYLSKKYNRKRRIKDKRKFMGEHTPELKRCRGKVVLDIGPGPGEYLEICRDLGHTGIGIDAKITDSEMGNEYMKLAQLMRDRQKLDIDYTGFDTCLNCIAPDVLMPPPRSVFYIVSQGSIEQCFKDYMEGVPHRETKDASQLRWKNEPATWKIFKKMFEEFNRILEPGGFVVIWGNGSKNNDIYDKMVRQIAKGASFKLIEKKSLRFHKWQKA